jgi:hypothetical protein
MRSLQASLVLPFFMLASTAQAQFWIPYPYPYPIPVPTANPETTLTVGVAGNITSTRSLSGGVSSETISTAQIDGVLRAVAPSTFGQNFTRDKANKAFADFNNFRINLATSLTQTIATQPNIRRVNSVTVNTLSLNLRLSQKTNSVSGELGKAMGAVSLVADVDGIKALFCPSANVTFNVDNIRVSGDYNYITGDVSNVAAAYDVTNVVASCNGLLGFIGNAIGNPSATARSQINAVIQSQASSQLAFANMKQLFSLADFANGLNYFRNESPVSVFANRAISVFRELVNDAAINTPGIVLDFGVQFGGGISGANKISIIASHAPINVSVGNSSGNFTQLILNNVFLARPPNTEGTVDLYYILQNDTANWRYLASMTTDSMVITTPLPSNQIIAIGRSSIIPGLQSLPGTQGTIIQTPFCIERQCFNF